MNRQSPSLTSIAEFKGDVGQWAVKIRVKPLRVRVQRMSRKWASCSSRGTLSFNSELLAQSSEFRDFVIVHELLHLKVPNHGKLFKTLLRAYIPDCEKIAQSQQKKKIDSP